MLKYFKRRNRHGSSARRGDFKKVIAIPTVNDNEKEVADYLASLFAPYEDQGVTIEELAYSPGRSNLIVTIGEGRPR